MFSDTHCPISISISGSSGFNNVRAANKCTAVEDESNTEVKNVSFKWSSDSSDDFNNAFSNDDFNRLTAGIEDVLTNPCKININSFCNEINSILIEKAKQCGICKENNNFGNKT